MFASQDRALTRAVIPSAADGTLPAPDNGGPGHRACAGTVLGARPAIPRTRRCLEGTEGARGPRCPATCRYPAGIAMAADGRRRFARACLAGLERSVGRLRRAPTGRFYVGRRDIHAKAYIVTRDEVAPLVHRASRGDTPWGTRGGGATGATGADPHSRSTQAPAEGPDTKREQPRRGAAPVRPRGGHRVNRKWW
jgi:hypothetical protein